MNMQLSKKKKKNNTDLIDSVQGAPKMLYWEMCVSMARGTDNPDCNTCHF